MIEGVGLFLAGLIGGMVNAIAGGGSFITFPALMVAGVSPIAANATNTFASSAGYLSGATGFRRELWAHRHQLPRVAVSALIGGALGAWQRSAFGNARPAPDRFHPELAEPARVVPRRPQDAGLRCPDARLSALPRSD